MASSKKPAPPTVKTRTLFADVGRAEKIVGSFDENSDDLLIDTAKQRFINQVRDGGGDVNGIKFRLEANDVDA